MKKALYLLLALSLMFTLCACGKSEIKKQNELAAQRLEAEISLLGELNFNSGDIIASIREDYESESEDVQALVTNYAVLEEAEEKLPAVRAGIVSDETAAILDMPAETEADISAIDAAAESVRMKYDMLDHNEKEMVKDYDKLDEKITESETVLAQTVLKDVKMWTEQVYSSLKVYITFTNPNEKTIKYIEWGVMFQNAVGDYMEYYGNNIYTCEETGPYETGKGGDGSMCWKFYSSMVNIYDVTAVRLGSVAIEYMDGSTVTIENPEALDTVMKQ